MKKLDTQEIIKRFVTVHGTKYDYSKVVYSGMEGKVVILCPVHGEFKQTPHNHLKYGCSKCGKSRQVLKRTFSTEQFISRARDVHGDKYDYSLVEYINAKTPIKVICTKHGLFEQTPDTHLHSYGCPKCGLEIGSKKVSSVKHTRKYGMPLDTFNNLCTKLFNGKYDYSLIDETSWNGLNTTINIICPQHGIFKQVAKNHRWGMGCRKCNQSKGESKIKNYLDSTGVKYITEYTFSDCVDKSELPFDFALFNSDGTIRCLIEYQGNQHFEVVKFWGRTQKDLEEQQRRDQIKRDYCLAHNHCLLEVSYKQDLNEFFEEAGGLLWK